MQRQRFIPTIKNVTEKKKKSQKLNQISSANKIDNYSKAEQKEKEMKKIYRTSQNIRIINVFLESLLSSPFLRWESQSTSLPQEALQHCADLWTCCGGSSDSNLVLLLCVLASNVHSYQSWCFFFLGTFQHPFIYSLDAEPAQLIVWI